MLLVDVRNFWFLICHWHLLNIITFIFQYESIRCAKILIVILILPLLELYPILLMQNFRLAVLVSVFYEFI